MRNKIIYILLIINVLFSCKEKDAPVVSYWDDGVLKSELRYKDGKLDGVCKWYYRNGNPEMEATYSMNMLNGEATRWYENGNLEEKSYYKDNQYDLHINFTKTGRDEHSNGHHIVVYSRHDVAL